MNQETPHIVLCNGADLPEGLGHQARDPLALEYRDTGTSTKNINLSLPDFVRGVVHLPDRVLDLLEIAAYIFAADRRVTRGAKDALEYDSWPRAFSFVIKVRDIEFWEKRSTKQKLEEALRFMSGDRSFDFAFRSGHSTGRTSLFDRREFVIEPNEPTSVLLFSGGLDSLAGALHRLEDSKDRVYLISHRSQPGTKRTQDALVAALQSRYPNRVHHYRFDLTLKGIRAAEETQRTRALLYTSIAYALSTALNTECFYVFENGMTAINFPKRQDMMNARASRTTHPKAIALLQELFSLIGESRVLIDTPFLLKTKTDVMSLLAERGGRDLITSTVSCSKTFKLAVGSTHCGGCSQCIDRRFAAYGSELDDADEGGIYAHDFIDETTDDAEMKTMLVDYVRQANSFQSWSIDRFYKELLNELVDVLDYIPGCLDETEALEKLWQLAHRHGEQVLSAIRRMREIHDSPFATISQGSFISLVSTREYLKEPVQRLVESISDRMKRAIPIAFQHKRPDNENQLNDFVSALLQSEKDQFQREHPAVSFALAGVRPDHSAVKRDLWIESKYIREATSPSKASEGMAADLTKYPGGCHILFVVYDPDRSVADDQKFTSDFESKGRCAVCIVR